MENKNINQSKTKKIVTAIVSVILSFLVIGGVTAGILLLTRNNDEVTQEISLKWTVGDLNEEGKYKPSKTSIYTKDAFDCQGLMIMPDFESDFTYRLYFYDSSENLMSVTDEYSEPFMDELEFGVCKARIVITPNDTEEISSKMKKELSKKLTVSVLKVQVGAPAFVKLEFEDSETVYGDFEGNVKYGDTQIKYAYHTTKPIDVSGYSKVMVYTMYPIAYYFGDKNGKSFGDRVILYEGNNNPYTYLEIYIPDGVKYIRLANTLGYWTKAPYKVYLVK